MRSNNIPTLKNFVGGLLFGFLVIVLAFATVGCAKDKKSSGWGYGYGWNGWGTPYQGGPAVGQYVGNSPYGFQLALQFNTTGANVIPGAPYVGDAWANGVFYVRSGGVVCPSGAYLPPGYYQINPANQIPAVMFTTSQGSAISNMTLLAQGPVPVEIRILNATLVGPGFLDNLGYTGYACPNITGFNEMYGDIRISVNGVLCYINTYIDYLTTPSQMVCQ